MLANPSFYSRVLAFAVLLALVVIVLGAYTRLSDAGLGCPDWPGCYGHLSVPDKITTDEFERPLEKHKAWKEMVHRYVAGTLGLMVLLILFLVWKKKPVLKQSIVLPIFLLVTIIFQALLGMWTVTLLLSPLIVSAHLLGGFTTLSLLWWLFLNQQKRQKLISQFEPSAFLKVTTLIALVLVVIQILLGGWTSSNYAALACSTEFPTCGSSWWPTMDFVNGFDLSHKPGVNYEFGVLDSPARTAIHFTHRIGALTVFIYFSLFAIMLLKTKPTMKPLAYTLLFLLFVQVSLGIMNVVLALPLAIAVLHNLGAILLLLTVLAIAHRLFFNRYVE
jgi:cytochrome c oxidase assembly protein subunit 15